MQVGNIFGVVAAALVMFFVLSVLHLGNIKQTISLRIAELEEAGVTEIIYDGTHKDIAARAYSLQEIKAFSPEAQNEILKTRAGLGGEKIPAPQASLMAAVAKGIFERKTEWILILSGMLMGIALILMQVRSPMLIAVGMYLPIDTSFAIFLGGVFKALLEKSIETKRLEPKEKERVSNQGTLLASGLIAGEAIIGIFFATLTFAEIKIWHVFASPSYLLSLLGITALGLFLVWRSQRKEKKVETG